MNGSRPAGSALSGRIALVTGVSRQIGIARAVAERLADRGAIVFATGWSPHDAEMPWGADGEPDAYDRITFEQRDLEQQHQPEALIDAVVDVHGAIDIVVAVHARSSHNSLAEVTAGELDRCWAANVRSIVLLAQQFARRHDRDRPGSWGRMIWFTSGQHLGPMPAEIAYAVTKGAVQAMTQTLAEPLAEAGIVANCVNPGPVDTGWADGDTHEAVAAMFPSGRWGTPDNVADLIEFLVSDQGGWIQGQVINSEGGFRRR